MRALTASCIALHNASAVAARTAMQRCPDMASLPAATLPCRVLAKGRHEFASQSIHRQLHFPERHQNPIGRRLHTCAIHT
jgi:hypothetical protein